MFVVLEIELKIYEHLLKISLYNMKFEGILILVKYAEIPYFILQYFDTCLFAYH